MPLWNPQWALKATDHLLRAFNSELAHSKALLPCTSDDSVPLIQGEGRISSEASWTDAKTRRKKLEKKLLSGILHSEVRQNFCSLWLGSQRIRTKEKPQRKMFFHSSPGSTYFCTVESHWVQSQLQMDEGTNLIYTQPNKQGFCKIPLCLSAIKRHYLAFQFDGQGNRAG